MKIMAVDTATTSCSVAIVDKKSIRAELTLVKGQTHSKHLMDMIDTVLDLSGIKISDIDGFATSSGPGSFTGLRIGISTVKGLAAASGKPMVGISTLEVLAMQVSFSPYLICPLLDASRGEVYFSRYRFVSGHLKREIPERVFPADKAVSDLDESCIFVGNGALLYKKMLLDKLGKRALFTEIPQNVIKASTLAYLGMKRFEGNDTDDIGIFIPNYIRKSDAEVKFNGKNC